MKIDNKNCNIINDILPLYIDDVVSDDTKAFVETHLEGCEKCRANAEKMSKTVEIPTNTNIFDAEKNTLKNIKRKILNKKVIVSVVSVLISISVLFGAFLFANLVYFPIEYDPSTMTVVTKNNDIYIEYDKPYARSVGHSAEDVIIDGESKNILIISLEYDLWSKYIEPLYSQNEKSFEKIWIANTDENDVIYYSNVNPIENTNYYEIAEFSKKCFPIWEK